MNYPDISYSDIHKPKEVIDDGAITLLAESGTFATSLALLRAGTPGVPPHFHNHQAETFLVLGGSLDALYGDEVHTLSAGQVLIVEPKVVHALRAAGEADVELFALTTPPYERFAYYRLLDRIQAGEASFADLEADQERFDSYFVDSDAWTAHVDEEAGR